MYVLNKFFGRECRFIRTTRQRFILETFGSISISGNELETKLAIASRQISQGIPATIYNIVSPEPDCMSAANYVQLPETG